MQENVNPYSEGEFKNKFKRSDLFLEIKKDFPYCIFQDLDMKSLNQLRTDIISQKHILTPRQHTSTSIFSLVPFYYLQFILDNNPNVIYDIGCGWNIFKRYIPIIIGLEVPDKSPNYLKYADIHDELLFEFSDYVEKYYGKYENAIAINSLHFCPISKIRQRIIDFSNLIQRGGMGFITFNIKRMLECEDLFTNTEKVNLFNFSELETWIRHELNDLPFEIKVFEFLPLNDRTIDEWLNGNLRIVFKKT